MKLNKASLTRGITLAADILATEIRKITSRGGPGGYPAAIPESITVGTAVVTDTGAAIGISTVDKGNENVELTLAFELGSGLTGPKGQRYPIEPVKGNILSFMWPQARNIGGREGVRDVVDESGRAFLTKVMHPGIKPNPFLDIAFQAVEPKMFDIIGQNFEVKMVGPKVETIK